MSARIALPLILFAATEAGAACLNPAPPDPSDPARGMVSVEGGTVLMGSDDHYPEERPVREASVGAFWIDATEVTNAQFDAFVTATGYETIAERGLPAEDYPGVPESLLAPGSMVFAPPGETVALDDHTRWWRYVHGANWRAPLGPGSSIGLRRRPRGRRNGGAANVDRPSLAGDGGAQRRGRGFTEASRPRHRRNGCGRRVAPNA